VSKRAPHTYCSYRYLFDICQRMINRAGENVKGKSQAFFHSSDLILHSSRTSVFRETVRMHAYSVYCFQQQAYRCLGTQIIRKTKSFHSSWSGDLHSCFILGRSRVLTSSWRAAILTEVFRGFRQFLQANFGIVHQIWPRPLPSTYFPVRCSLVTLIGCCVILVT
jgi:hypothetical protein